MIDTNKASNHNYGIENSSLFISFMIFNVILCALLLQSSLAISHAHQEPAAEHSHHDHRSHHDHAHNHDDDHNHNLTLPETSSATLANESFFRRATGRLSALVRTLLPEDLTREQLHEIGELAHVVWTGEEHQHRDTWGAVAKSLLESQTWRLWLRGLNLPQTLVRAYQGMHWKGKEATPSSKHFRNLLMIVGTAETTEYLLPPTFLLLSAVAPTADLQIWFRWLAAGSVPFAIPFVGFCGAGSLAYLFVPPARRVMSKALDAAMGGAITRRLEPFVNHISQLETLRKACETNVNVRIELTALAPLPGAENLGVAGEGRYHFRVSLLPPVGAVGDETSDASSLPAILTLEFITDRGANGDDTTYLSHIDVDLALFSQYGGLAAIPDPFKKALHWSPRHTIWKLLKKIAEGDFSEMESYSRQFVVQRLTSSVEMDFMSGDPSTGTPAASMMTGSVSVDYVPKSVHSGDRIVLKPRLWRDAAQRAAAWCNRTLANVIL